MKKFNINKTMYIHILPTGWNYLKREYGNEYVEKCIKPYKVMINDKEYYAMQCWKVFNTLPACIELNDIFEDDVLFKDSEVKNVYPDKNLPDKIETIQDVRDFAEYLRVVECVQICPDDSFLEYVNYATYKQTYTIEEADKRDKLMEQCFEVCEREKVDIYELLSRD